MPTEVEFLSVEAGAVEVLEVVEIAHDPFSALSSGGGTPAPSDYKESVRAATTATITLSGLQTIDGVTLVAGNRVLVKNQSTGAQNGLYSAAVGGWARTSDANSSAEVTAGLAVHVEEGTTNGNSDFRLTTNNPITLGTTSLTFAVVSGGGGAVTSVDGQIGAVSLASTYQPLNQGNQVYVVASQAAMLATGANVGDLARRTDTSETFMLDVAPASTLGNWVKIAEAPSGGASGDETYVVASQAAMLATGAQVGDIARRTDTGETYILDVAPATVLANWVKIADSPSGAGTFLPLDGTGVMAAYPDAAMKVATRDYTDAGGRRATTRLLQKIAANYGDSSIVWVGNSIDTDWSPGINNTPLQLAQYIGSQFPILDVDLIYYNDVSNSYLTPTVIQAGSGSRKLRFYVASIAGSRLDYWMGHRLAPAVVAINPDLLVIAHSMNEGPVTTTQTPEQVRGRLAGGIDVIAAAAPNAHLLILAQNKRSGDTTQEAKAQLLGDIAAVRNAGFVDICKAFIDDGRPIISAPAVPATDLTLDGVHLSQNGQDLQFDTLKPFFTKEGPQVAPAGLALPTFTDLFVKNIARNPQFRSWDQAAHTVTGGVTTNTSVIISTAGGSKIGPNDIGAPISGTGIPAGAILMTVNPILGEATISLAATSSNTGVTFSIGQAPPPGWENVNAIFSKDTTNVPDGHTYSCRVQALTAGPSGIRQSLLTATQVTAFQGKYVSVSVRVRVPSTKTGANVAQIRLGDGVTSVNSVVSTTGPFTTFAVRTLTMKVDAAATSLTLTVFADAGSDASADISIARVSVVEGMLPRDIGQVKSLDLYGRLEISGDFSVNRSYGGNYGRIEVGDPTNVYGQVFGWPFVVKYFHLTGAFPFRESGYAGDLLGDGNTPPLMQWPVLVGYNATIGGPGYSLNMAFDAGVTVPVPSADGHAARRLDVWQGRTQVQVATGTLTITTGGTYIFSGTAGSQFWSLPSIATTGAGTRVRMFNKNTAAAGIIPVPDGSDVMTDNGIVMPIGTIAIQPGEVCEFLNDGTQWVVHRTPGFGKTFAYETSTALTINTQHLGRIIVINSATARALTIDGAGTWPLGAWIDVTAKGGGAHSLVGTNGTTFTSTEATDSATSRILTEGVTVRVVHIGSNEWAISGDLQAARVVVTNAPGATPAIEQSATMLAEFTGLAVAITSMTSGLTGTPRVGQRLTIAFTDNGTARTIAWGAGYATPGTLSALPTQTIPSTRLVTEFIRNAANTAWDLISVSRAEPRTISTAAPGATPTVNGNLYDIVRFTGLAANITSMTTNLVGTFTDGQKLLLTFVDNGTARTIAWGASYANTTFGALPLTTPGNTTIRLYVALMYNAATGKLDCVGVA